MKKLALAILLLLPATIFAAADKPNRADFPLTVHVVSSAWQIGYSNTPSYQVLETVIGDQSVELQQGGTSGVLALGDYPARISPKIHGPKNPNTYDIYRGYDLLMPDGTTRTYTVTGLGPASTNP
jgi:hypothetical protein